MTKPRWRLLTGIAFALCLSGCGGDSSNSTRSMPFSERPWVEEAELLDDPSLLVTPRQVVVLNLAAGGASLRHEIRYRFEDTTTYSFCIPEDEPHIRSVELFEGRETTPLFRIVPGTVCETRMIEEGSYRLVIEHDGAGIGDGGRKAFVHVPRLTEEAPPLGSAQTSPGGLEVCNGLGLIALSNGYLNVGGGNPPAVTVQGGGDLSNAGWQICQDSKGTYELYRSGPTPQVFATNSVGTQAMFLQGNGNLVVQSNSVSPYTSPLTLIDLGDWEFQLFSTSPSNPIVIGTGGNLYAAPGAAPQTYTMPVKYYLPNITPPPLQMGEVAIYPAGGFSIARGTWVVRGNVANVNPITYKNPQTNLILDLGYSPDTIFGVRPGPLTVATFYLDPNFNTQTSFVGEDNPNALEYYQSIKVAAARDFIIATNSCQKCNLTGIDLSGLDLTKGNFLQSTFTSASLFETNLTEANLTGANLSGSDIVLAETNFQNAILANTSFRGADLSESYADSTNGLVVPPGFTHRPDLSNATIDLDTFLLSDWRYLNLTGAKIFDYQGTPLSTGTCPMDFSGAVLDDVDLHGALLDGAIFGCDADSNPAVCASLVNTNLNNASLKRAWFADANLQGAKLEGANLDEANLCSAHLDESPDQKKSASLQKAFLRNVNLYNAVLTGANFSNADFFSTTTSGICDGTSCGATNCATASHARLDSAIFAHAYLAGTDFSNASGKGVDFEHALLMGANFTSANLSNTDSSGNVTNFRQADLRGTNFTSADVADADFNGAFVSTQSGTATVKLDGDNTAFVGFTPSSPAAAGCVQFTYPHASATPHTDNTNTCPNSSTGACSSSAWTLPTPTPGCSSIDFNWGIAPTAIPTHTPTRTPTITPTRTFTPTWTPRRTQ